MLFHHSFSLGKKSSCVISVKEGNFVSAEMTWETTYSAFSYFWLFFWNTLRWMELFLKHSKLKCSQSFSRLEPFTLFCFFVHRVRTDLPSLLAHLPLRQVTGKAKKFWKIRSKCLLAYLSCEERGASVPPVCVALVCVRIYPITGVSLENTGEETRGMQQVLRQSRGFGWFRPS